MPAGHLSAEVRLLQAVSIHDVQQVLQHAVKHLVQFFPDDGQRLLRWQYGCVEFHLRQQNECNQMTRTNFTTTAAMISCLKNGTSKTKKLLTILLAASEKCVKRKRLKVEAPTIDGCLD